MLPKLPALLALGAHIWVAHASFVSTCGPRVGGCCLIKLLSDTDPVLECQCNDNNGNLQTSALQLNSFLANIGGVLTPKFNGNAGFSCQNWGYNADNTGVFADCGANRQGLQIDGITDNINGILQVTVDTRKVSASPHLGGCD